VLQPDGVQRGLVGEVIKRFEQRGYKLVGLKMLNVERSLAEKHYADLSEKPFFGALVDYICSGPVVAMVGSCWIPQFKMDSCFSSRSSSRSCRAH
jgi:nucleoside-diphosphate kinase